jgi:hypothetical protein
VWLNANVKKKLKLAPLVVLTDCPGVIHANRPVLFSFEPMASALQNLITVIGVHVV